VAGARPPLSIGPIGVRLSGESWKRTICAVTDGPSPRREWIGGFDLLEGGDIAEAVEIASRHLMACIGSILT